MELSNLSILQATYIKNNLQELIEESGEIESLVWLALIQEVHKMTLLQLWIIRISSKLIITDVYTSVSCLHFTCHVKVFVRNIRLPNWEKGLAIICKAAKCSICQLFLIRDGTKCPCCNTPLRIKPHDSRTKKRDRQRLNKIEII